MKSVNLDGKINKDLMDKLVTFITETTYEELPQELVALSKKAIIDTIGVSLAGWHEPAVEAVKKIYGNQTGVSSLWGEAQQVDSEKAAVINGTASHVLDYDDASPGVIIHPSAPILAAITPLADKLNSSGQAVITAYVIGTEVMVRIGQVMGIKHYNLGWHATSTLGAIGAVAACAYLQRLNVEQCTNAIAIAASMAGGLQKNFGSMTKPLHVGLAAGQGIQAVQLAKQGFTGNSQIFGGRGFFLAFSGLNDEVELKNATSSIEFGTPYDLLTGLSVKKFPCCFGTHRFIQGALLLKEEHQLHIDMVEEIVLRAQPRSLLPLVHSRPVTGLQGKFSAEYTVLAALLDGHVRLSSFEDAQVQRPDIQNRLANVHVVAIEETEEEKRLDQRLPIEIQIKTKDGQVYEKVVLHAPGSIVNPLSETEHREKWVSCLSYYMQSEASVTEPVANELYENGLQMDQYTYFGEWLNEIPKKLNVYRPKQTV